MSFGNDFESHGAINIPDAHSEHMPHHHHGDSNAFEHIEMVESAAARIRDRRWHKKLLMHLEYKFTHYL